MHLLAKAFVSGIGFSLALSASFACFLWVVDWHPGDGIPHSLLSTLGTFVAAQDENIQVRLVANILTVIVANAAQYNGRWLVAPNQLSVEASFPGNFTTLSLMYTLTPTRIEFRIRSLKHLDCRTRSREHRSRQTCSPARCPQCTEIVTPPNTYSTKA